MKEALHRTVAEPEAPDHRRDRLPAVRTRAGQPVLPDRRAAPREGPVILTSNLAF
nr:hypothetical protein [Hyphomicrobium sulfonivorans]